jgi:hypothetical protein
MPMSSSVGPMPVSGGFFRRSSVNILASARYRRVIEEIASLNWQGLTRQDVLAAAHAYYYFSVQFRENLEIAVALHPWDAGLAELHAGECDTANLSPFPDVAAPGEKMDHDEFMRRLLRHSDLEPARLHSITRLGAAYLAECRGVDRLARALSISSYEDGGLEAVFTAILSAPNWTGTALLAFRHFLTEHIRFDSDVETGHGALGRSLVPDDRILPLWEAFYDLLIGAAPKLLG